MLNYKLYENIGASILFRLDVFQQYSLIAPPLNACMQRYIVYV